MTQEEKELLLKDLCARLPYGVRVHLIFDKNLQVTREMGLNSLHDIMFGNANGKPYLRPMSSITEEEREEFEFLGWRIDELNGNEPWNLNSYCVFDGVDWLNKKMFDYRCLIEKNLALEAPEDMYV